MTNASYFNPGRFALAESAMTHSYSDMSSLAMIIYAIGAATASILFVRFFRFVLLYVRSGSIDRFRHGSEPWALITGASDGIGLAFARELSKAGFNILLHGRNPEKLAGVKDQLSSTFPERNFKIVIANASAPNEEQQKSIEDITRDVRDLNVTVLVNNVGAVQIGGRKKFKTFQGHPVMEIDGIVNMNDRFMTQLTHALLPQLTRNGPSLVMNIGSGTNIGYPYMSIYSATKAYLETWTRSLHTEMAAEGVDVEVLGIIVNLVTGVSHQKYTPTFFTPDSAIMAQAALRRVGCGKPVVMGYIGHAIQKAAFDFMPHEIVIKLITGNMRQMMAEESKAQ
ncbi:MAG: hypothetical protein M1833_001771 [Piccolia ochrophora]|nr:MAG: hypothetical protein M1833_001771 [Piccolia ochrophora]